MIVYKPINKAFRNRLEAKIALGSGKFNRLFKNQPDDFIITDSNNLSADYEFFYTNPLEFSKSINKK